MAAMCCGKASISPPPRLSVFPIACRCRIGIPHGLWLAQKPAAKSTVLQQFWCLLSWAPLSAVISVFWYAEWRRKHELECFCCRSGHRPRRCFRVAADTAAVASLLSARQKRWPSPSWLAPDHAASITVHLPVHPPPGCLSGTAHGTRTSSVHSMRTLASPCSMPGPVARSARIGVPLWLALGACVLAGLGAHGPVVGGAVEVHSGGADVDEHLPREQGDRGSEGPRGVQQPWRGPDAQEGGLTCRRACAWHMRTTTSPRLPFCHLSRRPACGRSPGLPARRC